MNKTNTRALEKLIAKHRGADAPDWDALEGDLVDLIDEILSCAAEDAHEAVASS